jgi:hypothetical protein
VFWVISVYFNIRNTLPKFFIFLPGHPVYEDLCAFMIISRSVLLRIRNVSDKPCTENQNTVLRLIIFFPEICAFYEIMWKNAVEPVGQQVTI